MCSPGVVKMKMKRVRKTDESDRALKSNHKPENCYCSALPKGSGLCIPCYTRWLAAGARKESGPRAIGRWAG